MLKALGKRSGSFMIKYLFIIDVIFQQETGCDVTS